MTGNSQQAFPDLVVINEANRVWQEKVKALKQLTPLHPETNEPGTFVDLVLARAGLLAVYETPSGLKFSIRSKTYQL